MNFKEIQEIKELLSDFSTLFFCFIELGGEFISDEKTETAYIKLENGVFTLGYNPKYFKNLTLYQKTFIVAHECSHYLYGHLDIMKKINPRFPRLFNVAADIKNNENLIKLGFSKKLADPKEALCWSKPITNRKFDDSMSVIDYYNLLTSDKDSIKRSENFEIADDHEAAIESEGNGDDVHSGDNGENLSKFIEEIPEIYKNDVKEELKDFCKSQEPDMKGGGSGIGSGNLSGLFKKLNQKPKKPFESIIKKWGKNKVNKIKKKREYEKNEFWGKSELTALLGDSYTVPSEQRGMEAPNSNDHLNVLLFCDVSGSCGPYMKRFFNAAMNLPEEYFTVNLYAFDTMIIPVSFDEAKKSASINAGWGGTKFSPMIKAYESHEKVDAVWVFTDGMNFDCDFDKKYKSSVNESNWYWFIIGHHSSKNRFKNQFDFSKFY